MSEFFLQRYRLIDPTVRTIEPSSVKQAIRTNTMKISDDELRRKLESLGVVLEKIPWVSHGYYAEAEFSLGATREYLLGHYYLQGPLSQMACEVLSPSRDDEVLDMAAAPGGKATYLATMARSVVALDANKQRLLSVRNNAERLGIPNIICMAKDARYARDLKKKFDTVILDAPCSGNFCSQENWFSSRTIDDVRKNARLQKDLIRSAAHCLRPGGRLLYSTCSLEPEEDELIADYLIRKEDMVLIDIPGSLGDPGILEWEGKKMDSSLLKARRFWPHKTGCEGFFMALFEKHQT